MTITNKINIINSTKQIWLSQISCARFKSSTAHLSDSYQYLQNSRLKTMYFQKSLPRLPIPQLEKTCERYLAALKPILNDTDYTNTVKIVNNFKTSTGSQLQKMLKDHDAANKHTSYISKPWFEMYLRDRIPLPINYNPILIMKNDERQQYNNQLIRTSNIIVTALRFMRALHAERLEPEVFHLNPAKSDTDLFRTIMGLAPSAFATYVAYTFKAFPLDMSQYHGLFGATRIPEIDEDRIYRKENTKHVLVMHKGNCYTVDVLDENGNIEPPNVILGRLKHVLEQNITEEKYPVGILTATERNSWATLRRHLIKIGNEKFIEQIDSALFCLCLDDTTYSLDNPIPLVKNFLAGDGTNRWFDKSFSVIITKDGIAGINFEHSWGDGVAVLRFFNEVYNETTQKPFINPDLQPKIDNDIEQKVKLLTFQIDDRLKKEITEAKNFHKDIMDSLDINYTRYEEINKNLCKTNNISPDSVMQLAFQLAFRQLHGNYVSTYESCSTAAFKHGRTEAMRPCTMATKEFCETVLNNKNNKAQLKSLISNCSKIHGNLTKDAAMGQGFDRHLFGLKYIGEKNGIKYPKLYEDIGYKTINYNILSTSTLSSPGLLAGGFGPVVKDGYGIGYNITNDLCGTVVSSYKNQRNGEDFIKSLNQAFDIIRDILYVKKV